MANAMRHFAPSRELARRARQLLTVAFLFVSIGIFLAIVGLAFYVVPLTSRESDWFVSFDAFRTLMFYGGILLGLTGIGLAVRAVTWRTENNLARQTGKILEPHLDSRYIFIRNLNRRGLGYIDGLLLGPAGLLVFRIIDFEGAYLNETDKWLKAKRGEWSPMMRSPTKDVIDDIESLREYLARNKLYDLPIFGAVVLTKNEPQTRVQLKSSTLPVIHAQALPTHLREFYLNKERIQSGVVKSLENLLAHDD